MQRVPASQRFHEMSLKCLRSRFLTHLVKNVCVVSGISALTAQEAGTGGDYTHLTSTNSHNSQPESATL